MKPIRILVVLCVSVLLLAQLLSAQADKPTGVKSEYDFRKTRWGMTEQQVIASEGKPFGELENFVVYKIELLGVKTNMSFWFVNNKLYRTGYVCSDKFAEPNTYLLMSARWLQALKEKYAKPETEVSWLNDLFRNDPKKFAFAISAGHLRIRNSWETERTQIVHAINGENYEIKLAVVYTSKQYSPEAEKQKKEEQKDVF